MDQNLLDDLERLLKTAGPAAALEQLCTRLRAEKSYDHLFYARLMASRFSLGLSPVPTAPASEIPADKQPAFEDAIRTAGREVGQLYLDEGKLAEAWAYFRMLGEPQALEQALQRHEPTPDEDIETVVQIALYEGVLPRKGFDWILQRYGVCNAITTLGGHQLPLSAEVRQYCVGQLVRTLYRDLVERVAADIARHEGTAPTVDGPVVGTLRGLIEGRPYLFGEDAYHLDLSHLSSVVQMSIDLPVGEDLSRARELCAYGSHLSPVFRHPQEPPFEDTYRDYGIYLDILADVNREAGLAHFRKIVDDNPAEEAGTAPAEMLVQLLLRLDRPVEALTIARRHLAEADRQRLGYLADLCQKANDFSALTEVAREQNNPVQFLAGLLAQQRG